MDNGVEIDSLSFRNPDTANVTLAENSSIQNTTKTSVDIISGKCCVNSYCW